MTVTSALWLQARLPKKRLLLRHPCAVVLPGRF
jgi:hypothetical protein